MDYIQDLTERAVSFITLIQDTILHKTVHNSLKPASTEIQEIFGPGFPEKLKTCMEGVKEYERKKVEPERTEESSSNPDQKIKIFDLESKTLELVWLSKNPPGNLKKNDIEKAERYLFAICCDLAIWITRNASSLTQKGEKLFDAFAPPQVWRNAITQCLYKSVEKRVSLAETLEYIPLHLVLALGGGGYDLETQRILQWWQTGKKSEEVVLTEGEKALHKKFEKTSYNSFADEREQDIKENTLGPEELHQFYHNKVKELLTDYRYLIKRLLAKEVPLVFPYIFSGELEEIQKNRNLRNKECSVKEPQLEAAVEKPMDSHEREDCNPQTNAQDMKLFALTFSGGGIRSATFNLGILQGLAKKGALRHVDYLSTVSGGGYIGSWLATWIKRDGSLAKVQDRLNPDKSSNPLGEEVRTIRWLRMFSNYLAPHKGIMSIDSWTIGITWFRNTLLNQVVILMMLLSLLLVLHSAYELWNYWHAWQDVLPGKVVYITACFLLVFLAYLTGLGMRWYNKGPQANPTSRIEGKQRLTSLIVIVAMAGAYIISASMYEQIKYEQLQEGLTFSFWNKLQVLIPAGVITFLILLVIAIIGRYDKCISAIQQKKPINKQDLRSYFILASTAFMAAVIGWLSLAGVWKLFELMRYSTFTILPLDYHKEENPLAFTVGIPLILLVIGSTVVARMAFLGKYFPDERREWWGRMGAIINRIAFIWLLVCASTTLLRHVLDTIYQNWKAPASIGGWVALVGGTVKAAFSPKTSGKTEAKGMQAMTLDLLSKAGPYIFALGLLIFLPALIEPLLEIQIFPDFIEARTYLKALLYAIAFFIPAVYLSNRLGVNEFSMHHFYRNRLVRAYLGATRRRSSRDRTVNPFTGFDKLDDEKLSSFRHDQGYYGPYPVLNTALNASQVSDLSRQDRKAESFIFSPLYSGFDFSKVRSSINTVLKSYDYGYRPTEKFAYANDKGPGIGTAMAISGAAANANQGYHSSAGAAFMLTVFNAQLGWWIGNPRKNKWTQSDPDFGLAYVFYNLTGKTSTRNDFVCLSDGGHFDNMGLYEMVRRRCSFIVVCDGEQDENFLCEGLANAIRRCRIDFGAEITINIEDIVKRDGRFSKQHYALGDIQYSGDEKPTAKLLYIKSSITGDEAVDVKEYALKNETFPHQTTGDQFFDEQQFESYRKLGMHIADEALKDPKVVEALQLNLAVETKEKIYIEKMDQTPDNLVKALKNFFIPKA